jgi:hypothetical protein
MHGDFEELNAYVYHSARGAVYDVVIWCLGPYVEPTRPHGRLRRILGVATRSAVRRWYRIQG